MNSATKALNRKLNRREPCHPEPHPDRGHLDVMRILIENRIERDRPVHTRDHFAAGWWISSPGVPSRVPFRVVFKG